jgi:cation-transporting ATPase 13A3/4/5
MDEATQINQMEAYFTANAPLGKTRNDYFQQAAFKDAVKGGCSNGVCIDSGGGAGLCQCGSLKKFVMKTFGEGKTVLGVNSNAVDTYEASFWVQGFDDMYQGSDCADLTPKWYHVRTMDDAAANPLPRLFYACWIMYAAIIAVWFVYKTYMTHCSGSVVSEAESTAIVAKTFEVAEQDRAATENIRSSIPLAGTGWVPAKGNLVTPGHISLQGFKDHWLGTLAHSFFWIFTISLLAVWGVLYFDTYYGCRCDSIDQACFSSLPYSPVFGGYTTNSTIMVINWFTCAVWFALIIAVFPKIRNFHRLPAGLTQATCIYAVAPMEAEVLTSKVTSPVKLLRSAKKSFGVGHSGNFGTLRVEQTVAAHKFFHFECNRYVLGIDGAWSHPHVETSLPCSEILDMAGGLTSEVHAEYIDYVGENEINFQVDGWLTLTRKELLKWFNLYLFQCYSALGWFSYLLVTICFDAVILLAASINIYLAHSNLVTIKKMTESDSKVEVLRDGMWTMTDAKKLVPRDVVRVVGGNWEIPCDLVVLSGGVIVDESGLTGEGMPVTKSPIDRTDATYSIAKHKNSTLFSGTKCIQAGSGKDFVTAMVVSSALDTSKGALVAAILFPRPMSFKYDEELTIVMILLFSYGAVCFPVCWAFQMMHGNSSGITKFVYGVDMYGRILSPLLSVALVMGEQLSARRLNKLDIFCINPKRIAISGKIRIMCFDKTGTLTKEGLDFRGVHATASQDETEGTGGKTGGKSWASDVASKSSGIVLNALASCHAVSQYINPTSNKNEFVGNQVEVQMFKSTGCKMEEKAGTVKISGSGVELTIVRKFEFDHAKMCMTVVVRDNKTGALRSFTKGGFEKIGTLANPESLPDDYLDVAKQHSLSGHYVLGLCSQALPAMTDEQLASLDRSELEKEGDGEFLSLVLFRNELKPDTREAILHLKEAHIRSVMITGDNAQCGYYIAKESGLLHNVADPSKTLPMWLGDYDTESKQVLWTILGDSDNGAKAGKMTGIKSTEDIIKDMQESSFELAVTSSAFNRLRGANGESEAIKTLLLNIRIFARMRPDDKVACVQHHVATDDLIVGMCGDGGNDSGALRTAHSGIALSEAEASIVSPFTSKTKSVGSVVDLIREGRAALTNSFAGYKYLIIYGQLFAMAKLASFYLGVIMSMMQYFFIDVISIIALGYAIIQSQPLERISPHRPTASLLGPITMLSVLGICFINFVFVAVGLTLMSQHPDYVEWPAPLASGAAWWTLGKNWECTYIFMLTASLFLASAPIYSLGWNFRKTWFMNWRLVVLSGFLIGFIWAGLLLDPIENGAIAQYFHFSSIQWNNPATAGTSLVWLKYNDASVSYDTDVVRHPTPAMSFDQRVSLIGLICAAIACSVFFEVAVVQRRLSSKSLKLPAFKI